MYDINVVGQIAKLKENPSGGGQKLEPGICSIPCKFAEVYNGQTDLYIQTSYIDQHHLIRMH